MNDSDHAPAGQALQTIKTALPMLPGEVSAFAVAAQAKALVEARYLMALNRPRDLDVVRQKVLAECRRPGFADNKSTYYIKPIGTGVEGLGIRFVEAALRCMTNVLIETPTVYEDAEKRILRVYVTDLEANTVYTKDVTVAKTVERSKVPEGVAPISKRLNSYGKWTYLVPATDDDLLNKEGALVSKAIRTLGLRIIPGDLQDEAEDLIKATRRDKAAKDPAATRKAIADGFLEIGITAQMLLEYLGHALDQTTPDELVQLRGLYGALRDEETTWAAIMEHKREQQAQRGEAPAQTASSDKPAAGAQPDGNAKLRDSMRASASAGPAKAASAAPEAGADGKAQAPAAASAQGEAPAAARKPRKAAQPAEAPAAPQGPQLPPADAPPVTWLDALVSTPEDQRPAFMAAAKAVVSAELYQQLDDKLADLVFGS